MAINTVVQQLCREEEVGLWRSFVGRADMYMRNGRHLSGRGTAVFADELSAAVNSDKGKHKTYFFYHGHIQWKYLENADVSTYSFYF